MAGEHLRAASAASPFLRQAGFRRRRIRFQRDEPSGFTSLVGFYPDPPGFQIQYGMVIPTQLAFAASRGRPRPEWPNTVDAVVFFIVFHPGWDPNQSDIYPYQWRAPYVDEERLPSQLGDALSNEVLPRLAAVADPASLVAVLEAPEVPGQFMAGARSLALARFEGGPSPELDRVLSQLEPSDKIRVWIEAELGRQDTNQ